MMEEKDWQSEDVVVTEWLRRRLLLAGAKDGASFPNVRD